MRMLFIHQNMPGQFRGLLPVLSANPAHEIFALGDAANIKHTFKKIPARLKLLGYRMPQDVKIAGHPFLSSTEHAVIRGEHVAHVLSDLKKKGLTPDVIFAHSGWGESFYIKDVFPSVRLINYCEFFYQTEGRDYNFDPEFPDSEIGAWNLRTRNAIQLLSCVSAWNKDPVGGVIGVQTRPH